MSSIMYILYIIYYIYIYHIKINNIKQSNRGPTTWSSATKFSPALKQSPRDRHLKKHSRNDAWSVPLYPLVNIQKAIENGHL